MDSTQREIACKLRDVFMRYRSFCRRHWPNRAMTYRELMALFRLREITSLNKEGVTISEISQSLRVTSPTVTQLINSLEASGLVKRSIDPADRRSIRVTLTAEGEKIVKEASTRFFSLHSGLIEHLGQDRSLLLIDLLSECIAYFNKATKELPTGEGK
ncbi:MAG: MarR family transcriptional regulator [Firmicutes bacterium]|nr:MarR family transcriptional regulator [Bacillota bacterium]